VVQAFDVALSKAIDQITQWALALPPPTTADIAKAAPEPEPATPPPKARARSPLQPPHAP
jgi:hypothetical protein